MPLHRRRDKMPKRIQRRRTKGWRIPPNTVCIGRPGKWGNPFKVGADGRTVAEAVAQYRHWLATTPEGQALAQEARQALRGKDLAWLVSAWAAVPCRGLASDRQRAVD